MTFYGDTVRKRYLYFAARPIDRTGIWLTRMALPLAAIAAYYLGPLRPGPRGSRSVAEDRVRLLWFWNRCPSLHGGRRDRFLVFSGDQCYF